MGARALSINGRRFAPLYQGVKLLAPCPNAERGGMAEMDVVTFDGLFQYTLVLISLASLIYLIVKEK